MAKEHYDAVVVGAGVIGLCTGYYLHKAGLKVAILDKGSLGEGAALKNAALVSPSHVLPLAQPGVLEQGFKWLWDRESPFYLKPRINKDLIAWAKAFHKACHRDRVAAAAPLLAELLLNSRGLFSELKATDLSQFWLRETGLLCVYKTRAAREHELHNMELAISWGQQAREVTLANFVEGHRVDALAGVWYENDATADPESFMVDLLRYLNDAGVTLLADTAVEELSIEGNQVKELICADRRIGCEQVVIASGVHSKPLLARSGVPLLLEPGKGYSLSAPVPEDKLHCPIIFTEGRVVITPLPSGTRFAGTMEISGLTPGITASRIRGIKKTIRSYLPYYDMTILDQAEPWFGFRPLSPDGLPYIGPIPGLSNAHINTGHAMLGLSLAPISGKLVADAIAAGGAIPPLLSVSRYQDGRFVPPEGGADQPEPAAEKELGGSQDAG